MFGIPDSEETVPIHLDNVECSGNERGIVDCVHNVIGSEDCQHTEDTGIICCKDNSVVCNQCISESMMCS